MQGVTHSKSQPESVLLRRESKIKGEDLRKQKLTCDIVYKWLKIVVDKKAKSRKRFPQVKSARKENISLHLDISPVK